MNYCLYCHSRFSNPVSWSNLIIPAQTFLCPPCTNSFSFIKEKGCTKCAKAYSKEYFVGSTCQDCIKWEEHLEWKGVFSKNCSVYQYNGFMKEVLTLFKFRGDYHLVNAFRKPLQKISNQMFHEHVIIPIPLSDERLYERGFNQAEALAELLDREVVDSLKRHHSEKQSKKSRQERLDSLNPFKVITPSKFHNKDVLLIDDIYTTGTTIRQAAKVLNMSGAKSVSSLTLARG